MFCRLLFVPLISFPLARFLFARFPLVFVVVACLLPLGSFSRVCLFSVVVFCCCSSGCLFSVLFFRLCFVSRLFVCLLSVFVCFVFVCFRSDLFFLSVGCFSRLSLSFCLCLLICFRLFVDLFYVCFPLACVCHAFSCCSCFGEFVVVRLFLLTLILLFRRLCCCSA